MARHASFSEREYMAQRKQTRRDGLLAKIEVVTPWLKLEQTVAPFDTRASGWRLSLFGFANLALAQR